MRYKFRAWLKDEKKMVKVSELRNIDTDIKSDENIIYFDFEKQEYCCKGFDEVELMQYIGKSDVHNVDICVGDIVKVHYEYESYNGYVEDSTLCVVEYVDEWCRVIFQYLYDKDGNYYSVEDLDMNDVEIVGNVWEHKYLLGEQNDS